MNAKECYRQHRRGQRLYRWLKQRHANPNLAMYPSHLPSGESERLSFLAGWAYAAFGIRW